MRVSYGLAPVYPAADTVELIKAADRLGFHGCYLGDDVRMQDPWVVSGAAARETATIRLGFSVTHVHLREPTLIAQALTTLDQLSGGRAEAGVGLGGMDLLDAHHAPWRDGRPITRLREAITVMRALLDEGRVDHLGDCYRYTGVTMDVRPVQTRLPLMVGAMVGPRSLQLAGEVGDGVHAAGVSRRYADYVVDQVGEGAAMAGRDPGELDLATYCVAVVAEDSQAAREAARALVAAWLPEFPPRLITRHGLAESAAEPVAAALGAGRFDEALRHTSDDLLDAFAVAGTPEDCVARIRTDLVDAGIGHLIMGVADPDLVAGMFGRPVGGIPDVTEQLALIHHHVVPAVRADPATQ